MSEINSASDVQENANMIQRAFASILDKALSATELAGQVQALQQQVAQLQQDLAKVREALDAERVAHDETAGALRQVRDELARKESTVHDLVQERDIVLEERNKAQAERDAALKDVEYWGEKCNRVEQLLAQAREHAHVLEERCNSLQSESNEFKGALRKFLS